MLEPGVRSRGDGKGAVSIERGPIEARTFE
jgi:hypothetical protein